MTTFVRQISDDADATFVGEGVDDIGTSFIQLGDASSSLYDFSTSLLFRNITIPSGSVASSAFLQSSFWWGAGTYPQTIVSVESADDTDTPTSRNDFYQRVRTSAKEPWDLAGYAVNEQITSPDLSSAVQEVINRPGWSSGNNIQIFWEDNTGSGFNGQSVVEGSPGDVVNSLLTIDYEEGTSEGLGGSTTTQTHSTEGFGGKVIRVTKQVSSDSDDGFRRNGGVFTTGSGMYLSVGDYVETIFDYSSFMRFVDVGVPENATILSATLTLLIYWVDGTVPETLIRADASSNAAAPTSASDMDGRVRTAAQVAWTPPSSTTFHSSPDISAVIQEVIDQPGWSPGNAVVVFWEDGTGEGWNGESAIYAYSHSVNPFDAATITIDYIEGSNNSRSGGSTTASTHSTEGAGVAVRPFEPTLTLVDGDVLVEWEAQDGATGYAVERDDEIIAFDVNETSYTDVAPPNGERTYRVGVIL